jgi:glycosyltransferase involved in cell wall biosynthesis
LDAFGLMADRTGCGTLRIELPLTALRAHNMETAFSERMSEHLQTRTVIGQRVCLPGITVAWQKMAAAPDHPRMILELDDDLWHVDGTSPIAHAFFSKPGVLENLEANLRASDAVTVTTESLADVVRQFNANVHVIPNYLPAWLLEHERPRRDGVVTIGWGGSSTHLMDVEEIGGQLRQVMTRNPHTELHLMGSNYAKELGVRERVRHSEWTNDVPAYWRAIDYDVMLAPLRANVFNASKSPLRPLEAAMLGIPVIASDYGPYAQFVRHGETGFLVKRDHEWGKYLRELVNDEAMRKEMGAAGRRQAADWTIEGNVEQWQKVIEG